MAESGVTIKGFDRVYRNLKKAMPDINKGVAKIFRTYGKLMVAEARANHAFTSQTGQLERAISFKVDAKNWLMKFYIDDVRVYSNGYNYGAIQNDGFGTGYKRGKISPAWGTKVSSKGLKADDFMGKAWEMFVGDMTKELQKLLIRELS